MSSASMFAFALSKIDTISVPHSSTENLSEAISSDVFSSCCAHQTRRILVIHCKCFCIAENTPVIPQLSALVLKELSTERGYLQVITAMSTHAQVVCSLHGHYIVCWFQIGFKFKQQSHDSNVSLLYRKHDRSLSILHVQDKYIIMQIGSCKWAQLYKVPKLRLLGPELACAHMYPCPSLFWIYSVLQKSIT